MGFRKKGNLESQKLSYRKLTRGPKNLNTRRHESIEQIGLRRCCSISHKASPDWLAT